MSDKETLRSVPAAAVKEASAAMLQKQLYAIFTTPVNGLGPVFETIEAHLAFQVSLEREGTLFAAGPLWSEDEQAWEGEGMVIVRAASRRDAIAIAERDPMHKSGARTFTVRPWMINEGSLTVRLDYSTQKFTIS
jgi:uncharacterized protein YciI